MIHIIINNYSLKSGGAERMVNYLFAGLKGQNNEVKLIGISNLDGVPELDDASTFNLNSPYDPRCLFKLLRYCKNEVTKNDVVHTHLFPTNLYVSIFKRLKIISAKTITTEHSTSNNRRNKWWGKILDYFLYGSYDKIIAISEGVKNELVKWLPRLKYKVDIIYNGIPLAATKSSFHNRDIPIIVSVGTLRKPKNYENLIRALALLSDVDFQYKIAGDGPDFKKIESLILELKLSDKVKLIGRVDPISQILKDADIFVIPSLWEGFGLAAVEAMNYGLPIVASNVAGLKELIEGKPFTGLLVEPSSPEDIAAKIMNLIADKKLRQILGANGLLRAQEFSDNKMVNKYITLYHSVLV